MKSKSRVYDVFQIYEAGNEAKRLRRSSTMKVTAAVPAQSETSCLDRLIIRKDYFPKSIFDSLIALFVGYSCFTSIF